MNTYVTGAVIRRLREEKGFTQAALAEQLHISDKAVSKWETGKGYPDIALLQPLAAALGTGINELLSGEELPDNSRHRIRKQVCFYVCPVCGNVIVSDGKAGINCCVELMPLQAEEADAEHEIHVERIDGEYYVSAGHEMSKEHYLSFIAAVRDNGWELIKLYPEGEAQAHFRLERIVKLYYYCNRHGLFAVSVRREQRKPNLLGINA